MAEAKTPKGPKKRGGRKKGVPNHCSLDPETLNAKEQKFCVLRNITGSIYQTAKIMKLNYMTAREWCDKPKIQKYYDELYEKSKSETLARSTDKLVSDVLYNVQLAVERTNEVLKSAPHPKRGYQDINNSSRTAIGMWKDMRGPQEPSVQVNVQTNIGISPAVEKLKSQQVYSPRAIREKYGITSPASDAVDQHFAALDAQRREAVAARRLALGGKDLRPMEGA